MSDETNVLKLPCDKKRNGEYVTLTNCNECSYSHKCDTFITLLDESFTYKANKIRGE